VKNHVVPPTAQKIDGMFRSVAGREGLNWLTTGGHLPFWL